MSFIAAKPTFIWLWLFVALLRLNNAEDITTSAEEGISACGEGEFECENKDCISSELLCDGRIDCSDASDETEVECARPELKCPSYTFRCNYGACIDIEAVCDGRVDCGPDSSDENPPNGCRPIGYMPSLPQPFGAPTPIIYPIDGYPLHSPSVYSSIGILTTGRRDCLLPLRPTNGQFKLRRISDSGDFEYVEPPSKEVKRDSYLVYSCNPGYTIRGQSVVQCLGMDKWSSKPVCIDIRCRSLGSVSTMANCTNASGRVKPCNSIQYIRPKTRAEVFCSPGYMAKSSTTLRQTVECNMNGKWKPEPITCSLACGVADPLQEPLSMDGTTTDRNSFPWHATLYVQNGTGNIFRCSATVIRATLLVTAAHCFRDVSTLWGNNSDGGIKTAEALAKFFITTENVHDDYNSLLTDFQSIRKYAVKNVHTTCNYQKSGLDFYDTDIAVVELHEPLQFSNTLLPACLDKIHIIQSFLETIANGRINDSAIFARDTSSQMLYDTLVPSETPHNQCITLYNATKSPFRVNGDKLSAKTDVCMGSMTSDGSGLVFKYRNHWHLMGIVSQLVRAETDIDQKMSGKNSDFFYTKLSKYMMWIQHVIYYLENFMYPTCSRYLPPFSTPSMIQSTTPIPTPSPSNTEIRMLPSSTTPAPSLNSIIRALPWNQEIKSGVGEARVIRNKSATFCSAPLEPANSKWRLVSDFSDRGTGDHIPKGSDFRSGDHLIYTCALGYRIIGNADVYCRSNGNWSPIPECTEIKCLSLNSISTIASCYRLGEALDCSYPVSSGTVAKVSCRPGYSVQHSQGDIVKCEMSGYWNPEPPSCAPACGATFGGLKTLPKREITEEVHNFPWHATLYVQTNSTGIWKKHLRCGATLIQANLLLTAAHCVRKKGTRRLENHWNLFILMSNIRRDYYSRLHDPHFVKRGTIKDVHVSCNYLRRKNNYAADIALLELQDPFEFWNTQLPPPCLDFPGYELEAFGPGSFGVHIGYGQSATGVTSDVLQAITVPYVSREQCKSANIYPEKEYFIGSDQFCAGYNNGSAVCLGDGGGGLFVDVGGLWYLVGIVSVGPGGDSDIDENNCDGKVYTLYTKLANHMSWILDVMFKLERYKSYPPCKHPPLPLFSDSYN